MPYTSVGLAVTEFVQGHRLAMWGLGTQCSWGSESTPPAGTSQELSCHHPQSPHWCSSYVPSVRNEVEMLWLNG